MEFEYLSYKHLREEKPLQEKFILHNHPHYFEVLFLIQGDISFSVEGSFYDVSPYDLCIARNNEFHQVMYHSSDAYERIVLQIEPRFFEKHHFDGLKILFLNRKLGQNNLITHEQTEAYQIPALFHKIDLYLNQNNMDAALCVILEILSILNHLPVSNNYNTWSTSRMNEITNYIHLHCAEKITLEQLATQFYLNKNYLCKIFKQSTGYTVNQYINLQRYLLAQELINQGIKKTEAALKAGFCNYAAYYKFMKKQST